MCVDGVGETQTAAWWDVDDALRGWERGVTKTESEAGRGQIPGAVCLCSLN